MAKTKYGIKVPIAVDDYIWVTQPTTAGEFDLQPVLYDSYDEAKQAAEIWGSLAQIEPFEVDTV